ncbi:MAG: hypothetical protein IH614_17125, partial [Desulfuromonadales bacterium]|nr:hypothetical protein [Desulfuromonadales bacterium]
NALRFARDLANILEKQRRQTAEAQSLLERVVRVFDQPSVQLLQRDHEGGE